MMPWTVEFTTEAKNDMRDLSRTQRFQINKAITKVSKNPLPNSEGGYGKPLGKKGATTLTGLLKIKLLKLEIRVVYKLVRVDKIMKIIVVAARADDEVYDIASKRS